MGHAVEPPPHRRGVSAQQKRNGGIDFGGCRVAIDTVWSPLPRLPTQPKQPLVDTKEM